MRPTEDFNLCRQTQEFGNTGCAEVAGTVTDVLGAAVVGAFVGVHGPVDPTSPVTLSSGDVRTDPTGRYSGRVIRYEGDVSPEGPDTRSWYRSLKTPLSSLQRFTPSGTQRG